MRTSPKFVKIPPLNVKYTLQNGKTYMTICKIYYWHKRNQSLVYHTAQQKKTVQQKIFSFSYPEEGSLPPEQRPAGTVTLPTISIHTQANLHRGCTSRWN